MWHVVSFPGPLQGVHWSVALIIAPELKGLPRSSLGDCWHPFVPQLRKLDTYPQSPLNKDSENGQWALFK